ncbi:hypothetical protein GRI39_14365, partial [Altererythrobacter indicus]|nr:hypothetical protein [Altericroceibacterium indicum]
MITSGLSLTVAENGTAVGTVAATDDDGDGLTFSLTGGADADLFTIDAATGALSFKVAPDYEAGQTSFVVEVSVSDGTIVTSDTVTITLTDVNEAPVITSALDVTVIEGDAGPVLFEAEDPDGDTLSWSIEPGGDGALFTIDGATGEISFKTAPDYANPADSDGDNVYALTITVDDGNGKSVTQDVTITVTDTNEAPEITSGGSVSLDENTTAVLSVVASDSDGDSLSYAIAGGADGALFTINAAGELSFKAAPDFENPADSDGDNVYDVIVSVSDGVTTTQQSVTVTVNDVNDAPVLTGPSGLSLAENTKTVGTITASDDEGDDLTFSLTGGVDADLFTINATTGALSFKVAPDYEAPGDDDGDNAYQLEVTVSDGTTSTVQQITVSVTDANDAPVITSSNAVTITENRSNVMIASASDVDSGDTLVWSIAGGADKDLFTVDSATGALSFITAPDYEAPSSFDGGNVYAVVLQVSDGNGG